MASSRVLIISPALNESEVLGDFVESFLQLKSDLSPSIDLRLFIVDDGSTDSTLELLKKLSELHSECISYISFTANFGYQAALVAGLMHAGNWPQAIITMDCDLEHPFEIVPRLIEMWRGQGCLVVNSIRRPSSKLSYRKRLFSKIFYYLTSKLTGLSLVSGQADFRLWDARTINGLSPYLPHIGSLRVFASWLPCKKGYLEYEQNVQTTRRSRFTFRKNWELAMISIIRFSNVPLHCITVLGAIGLLFSLIYGTFIIVETIRGHVLGHGWPSLILTVIIMGCLQLISFGVLASYLHRLVFSKDLPLFLIQEIRSNNWQNEISK